MYRPNNLTQLARTGPESFNRIYGSDGLPPNIVDKKQARHLYHLQRRPNVNPNLHLDNSDTCYEKEGYFENIVRKQVNGSSVPPVRTVYHRPTDMLDKSMAEKVYLDPQRIVPGQMATVRDDPSAMTKLRHDTTNEVAPCLTDRSVSNRINLGSRGEFFFVSFLLNFMFQAH